MSYEIILHSHLSRNPLDSKIKSSCDTTHIEAAIKKHAPCWWKGNALLFKASPKHKNQRSIPPRVLIIYIDNRLHEDYMSFDGLLA